MENDYSKRFEQIEAKKSAARKKSGPNTRPGGQELIFGTDTSEGNENLTTEEALLRLSQMTGRTARTAAGVAAEKRTVAASARRAAASDNSVSRRTFETDTEKHSRVTADPSRNSSRRSAVTGAADAVTAGAAGAAAAARKLFSGKASEDTTVEAAAAQKPAASTAKSAARRSSAAAGSAQRSAGSSAGAARRSSAAAGSAQRSSGSSAGTARRSSAAAGSAQRSSGSSAGTARRSSAAAGSAQRSSGSSAGAARRSSAAAGSARRPSTASGAARRSSGRRRRRRLNIPRVAVLALILVIALAVLIRVIDKPTITLSVENNASVTAQFGEADSVPAVTATYKSRLFHRKGVDVPVEQSGDTIDVNAFGTYAVSYKASYKGVRATADVSVEVVDTEPPVISLVSADDYYTPTGSDYVEEGFTATDNHDGDVTAQVNSSVTDGIVTYTVTDQAGNTATATREIVYKDKIIYLTFDDGPGQYTDELLDILKKYNVKATFFVTNQFPQYQDCIKREYEEGHTVAVHSYTHDFATIYTGVDDFFADVKQMADIIVQQTGVQPTLIRFPGGSDNTVSKKYCEGVMTDLCNVMSDYGYRYCDWNVTSGDADGVAYTSEELANNIIKRVQDRPLAIVLQHDIKKNSVGAVETVIQWAQENGYTFMPLTSTSYVFHFSTLNN